MYLGHGPLSHTFDGIYIPLMKPTVKWKVCNKIINFILILFAHKSYTLYAF